MQEPEIRPVSPIYWWLIAAASLLVPRGSRPAWRQEWFAEVEHRWTRQQAWRRLNLRAQLALLGKCRGAFADACWVRLKPLRRGVWQDFRYGIRLLRAEPGYTAAAALTMAVGIGAVAAVFSFVNGLLLRPLPFPNAERLFLIGRTTGSAGGGRFNLSFSDFSNLRHRQQVFTGMAAYDEGSFALTGAGEPAWISGAEVSANLFSILGMTPALGRDFLPGDDRLGTQRVAIVGYGLWRRQFGSDPGLVGKEIVLKGRTHRVAGIMPAGFNFPEDAEVWIPLTPDSRPANHNVEDCAVIARLRPGVSHEQARAEVDRLGEQLATEHSRPALPGPTLRPLREVYVQDARRTVLLFWGIVGVVLLIACANVAGLMLARLVERRREIAVRRAMGASRWRVARQLLIESLLLAFLGGALGLLLGWRGKRALLGAIPDDPPFWANFDFDAVLFAFVLLTTVVAGIGAGLAPAWQFSKGDPERALKGAGGSANRHRLSNLLMVSELALAFLLLSGAGLMMKSFLELRQADPGFAPADLLTMRMTLPDSRYRTARERQAFFEETVRRAKSVAGARHAAAVSELPLGGDRWYVEYSVESPSPNSAIGPMPAAAHRVVTPEYFDVIGIPLLRGRGFSATDGADRSLGVVIISQSLARRCWPDEDAIGKWLKYGKPDSGGSWLTVVGIVADIKNHDVRDAGNESLYVPLRQLPVSAMALVIRSTGDPLRLATPVREQIRGLDRDLPVYQIRTMEQMIRRSLWQSRFNSWLFAIFAATALLLAAIGVYAVISQSASQRAREISIRMALGARRGDVIGLVVGEGLRLTLIGLAIGLASAAVLTRILTGLLYDVSATDPATFAAASLLLFVVSTLACYLPARRAATADPIVALRCTV